MNSAGTAWEITGVIARDATDKNFPGILRRISPTDASNTPYRYIFTRSISVFFFFLLTDSV
jgi:hypothetical protein